MNITEEMGNWEEILKKNPYKNPAGNNTYNDGTWTCPMCNALVPENINVCYHGTVDNPPRVNYKKD